MQQSALNARLEVFTAMKIQVPPQHYTQHYNPQTTTWIRP